MTRRGAVLEAFIKHHFVASPRVGAQNYSQNDVSVTVHAIRGRGFAIETKWGEGYSMTPTEAERLGKDRWAQYSMKIGQSKSSVVVTMGVDTARVLSEMALEAGESIAITAARCIEHGINSMLSGAEV
jgi:hypothetical protein